MTSYKNKPAYHSWYGTARWKKARIRQLQREPLCHMCKAEGRTEAASVANHTKAHKGDPVLFWDETNLDSLCKRHHDSDQQSFEKGGVRTLAFDDEGWPVQDPNDLL